MRRLYVGCVALTLLGCKAVIPPGKILPPDADIVPPIVCFAAGTRIATPTGEVPIETLRPGDAVLAFDLGAQRVVSSHVTAVQAHVDRIAGEFSAGGRTLHLTSEHPIYLPARGSFVPAREVPAGSALLALSSGGTARVALGRPFAVAADARPQTVYDLTVDEQHDYFAEGILVHNKQPPRCPWNGQICPPPPVDRCQDRPRTTVAKPEAAARLGRWLWNDDGSGAVAMAERLGFDGSVDGVRMLVDELLKDPRARDGFNAFVEHWLLLDEEAPTGLVPAPLWSSFREETRRFLLQALLEDGDATKIYQADYTFVDETLALHYGLPLVNGWTKVTVPERGGLLAQGSLLSRYRSAPARGLFIYKRLHQCSDFPPVPPTHVNDSLKTPARAAVMSSIPDVCKGCHHLLDGPGWALQAYDELARFRTVDSDGMPLDSSGWLVADDRDVPLADRGDLAKALAESDEARGCFVLQVVGHAAARARVNPSERIAVDCLSGSWSPGRGFRELLHGVARTLVLDWPGPDGGAPDAASEPRDAAPDGAAD
ncbi:MAG TPA: DUF1592 domain-containing protein [Polyangia bacterium]|nr:DUF1592 domain-containing protein [Polyangia bacterium]